MCEECRGLLQGTDSQLQQRPRLEGRIERVGDGRNVEFGYGLSKSGGFSANGEDSSEVGAQFLQRSTDIEAHHKCALQIAQYGCFGSSAEEGGSDARSAVEAQNRSKLDFEGSKSTVNDSGLRAIQLLGQVKDVQPV